MAQTTEFRLLELVDELLIGIIDHVESKDDLRSLVLACSRLQGLAEPALYQFILIRRGVEAVQLSDAISSRPIRASFIRSLHIRYLHAYKKDIGVLNHNLKKMCSLQELMIEAPCCNDNHRLGDGFKSQGKIDYAEYFAFASSMTLESQPRVQVPLQTFTLHSHNEQGTGRNAFNMGRNAVIFLHPTLRNLTISCFDIEEDIEPYLSANRSRTVLRNLTFDECNITAKGLAAILSVPKALEKLSIGERMYHLHGYDHAPLGRSPEPFLQALALQKDSLQYLKHIGGRCDFPGSIAHLSMVAFANIRELELDIHSILSSILYEEANRGAPSIPANFHFRLIRSYHNISEQASNGLENPLLRSMYRWFKLVPHLDYIIDFNGRQDGDSILTDLWKDEKNHKIWKKIFDLAVSDVTQTQNTSNKRRLKILIVQSSGFIPPYMYGEKRPVEAVVFDSYNSR
ncbi:hypothetical protein N431DRAFT_477846 [Stipitochalara longipes BDJ]|nr:hypothetical protein N431DRAFT_477846 [Stipitochalara longipes BDJ]